MKFKDIRSILLAHLVLQWVFTILTPNRLQFTQQNFFILMDNFPKGIIR